ncbi:MAG: hypothetical protein JWM86_1613 [Thermoleophilia bacterium]|nr:hypothetical protein [Thermoleophilia bacterium]
MDPKDAAPAADATDGSGTPPDPMTADPRALMQLLLPAARRDYVRAWEWLADPATPLERRRLGRAKAQAIADAHGIVASALRARESSLSGDDLLNARHTADELERHAAALVRLTTISPIGLTTSDDLRPEKLGCGKRYRDPSKSEESASGTRGGADKPSGKRDGRGGGRGGANDPNAARNRDSTRPAPSDPKAPRDALGSSKHDSTLADDMDEATRAKLEELRRALEG